MITEINEQLWHKKMPVKEFLECVDQGMTIEEIQKKFSYSRRQPILVLSQRLTIYDLLKSRESNPTGGGVSPYNHEKIIQAVKDGKSYEEIIKEFGCSYSTAKKIVWKNGLHILKPKNRILNIEFTEDEFQVLYGTLLGDSNLSHKSTNVNGSFCQSTKQIEFALYKQNLLSRFTNPIKIVEKIDNRYNPAKHYEMAYCYIKASTALNALYSKVYKNKIKYIDKDTLYKLDGRGIAIWYMDDGAFNEYGYILCTDAFSASDLQLIQQFFKEKFDINITVRKNNEIYIKADSKEKFKNLIKPYIIPSMEYKL